MYTMTLKRGRFLIASHSSVGSTNSTSSLLRADGAIEEGVLAVLLEDDTT